MRIGIAALIGLLAGGAASPSPVAAAELAQPAGPVILVVSGAIANTNGRGEARFDQAMLEELGVSALVTTTPWTDGRIRFEGVLARDLMAAVGAQGREVTALALNDYKTTMPLADLQRPDVLLAFRQDGRAMPVRERGPIWVVYPVEPGTGVQSMETRAKMVWQLKELQVR